MIITVRLESGLMTIRNRERTPDVGRTRRMKKRDSTARLPLVLIPAFLVPLIIMLHVTSLIQSRKLAAAGKSCAWVGQRIQCGMEEAMKKA